MPDEVPIVPPALVCADISPATVSEPAGNAAINARGASAAGDGLLALVRCEEEEAARTRLEAGEIGFGNDPTGDFWPVLGNGTYAQLQRAIVGGSAAEHAEAVDWQMANELPRADEPMGEWLPREINHAALARAVAGLPPAVPSLAAALGPPRSEAAGVTADPQPQKGCATAARGSRTGYLPHEEVHELYRAIAFSNAHLGVILNTFVTITFSTLGLSGHGSAKTLFRKVKHETQKLLQRHRVVPVIVYVFENSPVHGLHVHCLLYVPSYGRRDFRIAVRGYLERLAGVQNGLPRHTVRFRHCRERGSTCDRITRQWYWFRYMVKGIDPNVFVLDLEEPEAWSKRLPVKEALALEKLEKSRPIDFSPRSGVTENIGKSARGKAGFVSRFDKSRSGRALYTAAEYDDWERRKRCAELESAIARI